MANNFSIACCIQALLLGLPATVSAQEPAAGAASDAEADAGAGIEEIVVTATKRDTALQETPIAVSAFSQESMNEAHVNDLATLQNLVPNLTVEQHGDSGGVHVYLRGIGSANHTELGDPAVAFHVDSVYSPRPQGATVLMYDVNHVEVLRGPQGTLFGRNATAGSVNIVTAKPDLSGFSAGSEVTMGDYNRLGTRAFLNVPAGDSFAFRLAAATERHDGYVDFQPRSSAVMSRKYGAVDQTGLRGTALWQPTDALDVTAAIEYFRDNGTGQVALLQDPRPGTDQYSALIDTAGFLDQDNLSYRLRIDYRPADWAELSYIGGYNDMSRRNASDNDAGAIPGFKQEHRTEWSSFESFTHELQLKSTGDGPFEWLVGAFMMEEDNAIRFDIDISDSDFADAGPIVVNPTQPDDLAWSMSFIQPKRTLESKAAFAQGSYSFTEALRLTLGARYTTEEKKDVGGRNWVCPDFGATIGSGGHLIGPGGPVTLETCDSAYTTPENPSYAWPGGGINDGKTEDSKTTWLARGEWKLDRDLMAYASVATGFKSGGLSDGGRRHLPEELINYELGLKSELFDRRLTLNTAVFYMDYSDLQVSAVERLPSGQQQLVTSNAAAATIEGVEIEFAWRPTDADSLSGFVSFLKAEYDNFLTVDSVYFDAGLDADADGTLDNLVDLSGQPLRHAPDFAGTLIYQHRFAFAKGELIPRIQFHYETETTISAFEHIYPELYQGHGVQDAYSKTDLGLRYEAEQGRWWIDAFVQNLEDEAVKTDIQNIGQSSDGTPTTPPSNLGTWAAFYNPPRTYGVSFGYRFD